MNRVKGVGGVFAVAAVLVIGLACGNAVTDDLSTPTPTQDPSEEVAETDEPTPSDSPIEFVMKDTYALGGDIEIKIRNSGTGSYVYSEYYPACNNLKFYDESEEARQLERLSGIVELPPGLFIVPEGTHCDIANESLIMPGEEVVLLTWSQHECVKDNWGCAESVPVKAGKYTIVGKFPEAKGPSDPNALSYEKGDETVAEWSFTIGPSEQAQTGSPDGSEALDYDYDSLIDDFVSAGATVEELTGPLTQYGFSVGGERVVVNEGTAHVFDFSDTATADLEASFVSADGRTLIVPSEGDLIMEVLHEWSATPHFYKKGMLIVVYIGDDQTIIDVLEGVLGMQFAGGTVPDSQPITGMIAPDLRLTFEGVEYTGVEVLSAASPTGPVMCCGTLINKEDMEVVGTGTQHNPDGDAGVQVYHPKAGGTTDVYTFTPAQIFQVSGEPGETDTTLDTWIRWAAK